MNKKILVKTLIIIAIFVVIFIFYAFFYKKTSITLPFGNKITVIIADNLVDRAQGLMHKKSLAGNKGMLFVFEEEGFYSFWMKNTLIPLDIVWLSGDKKIVDYKESAMPCLIDFCDKYINDQKAKYVLEVNAGFIKKENLKIGDKTIFSL